jgi:hypothetical protein
MCLKMFTSSVLITVFSRGNHFTLFPLQMRTGWDEKKPIAHTIVPQIQKWSHDGCNISAVMIHGRSRLQRYTKTADWEYIKAVAESQSPDMPRVPVIGASPGACSSSSSSPPPPPSSLYAFRSPIRFPCVCSLRLVQSGNHLGSPCMWARDLRCSAVGDVGRKR